MDDVTDIEPRARSADPEVGATPIPYRWTDESLGTTAADAPPAKQEGTARREWGVVEGGKVLHLDVHEALAVAQDESADAGNRAAAALVVQAYRLGLAMGAAG